MTGFIAYSFFPLELITAAMVFSWPLEKRTNCLARVLISILAVVAFFVLAGIFGTRQAMADIASFQQDLLAAVISNMFFCALIYLLIVLLLHFTCEVSWREAAYCGACAYLMEHVAYCVRLLIESYLPFLPVEPGSVLYFATHGLTYVLFYFLFAKRMVRNRHYGATVLSSLRLTVSVLFVVLVMSILASTFDFENLHAVYAIVFSLFVMYSQIGHQHELNLQKELEFERKLAMQQKAQYEMSRENIDLINRKCHDLKHQIAALRQIRDKSKQDEVITSLESSVMIYDAMQKTGNDILDTVLTEKSLICQSKGITLSCIADGARLSFLDPVDAYTLFGNALDNAIEAVSRLPQEERLIDFTVRDMLGLTMVKLVNRYAGDLSMSEGLPETTKEDKDWHGFGVHSIKAISEKYAGLVSFEADQGVFTLQISFPPQ